MKVFGIRAGNGIMRQYKNAKIRRNVFAGTAVMDFALATSNAQRKDGFGTFLLGSLTCLMMKLSKDNHLIMKQLKPEHDAILLRAKKIFK